MFNSFKYQFLYLQELRSIGDWIRWATSVFTEHKLYFGHGTDNAWDEAVHLVLQVLYLPLDVDRLVLGSVVLGDERKRLINAMSERVIGRKPLPYITHTAWCMGLPFYVDQRVLIPRSPFAECIQKQFAPWVNYDDVHAILEIGTGSGCLAIACALMFPDAQIDAVDIDAAALEVARINIERHQVGDQVRAIQSNCFEALSGKKYDIIFSNPPYVGADEMATLPPEYAHEPRHALLAEDDGLAIVLDILKNAVHYLSETGVLLVETGNSAPLLQERFPEIAFTWLEQEHGGDGIFLLTYEQLLTMQVSCVGE